MANENQPNLENMLLALSIETNVLKRLDKSKSIGEQANLYKTAAQMISQEEQGENYQRVIRELTRDPRYAHMEIEGHRDNFAKSIEGSYKENKDKIAKGIESKINEDLKQAKDKATASMILAQYLNEIVIESPEVSQDEVDQIERLGVQNMGLPYSFEARGSVGQYKSLELRKQASEYLKETKEKNGDKEVVSYTVDIKKLGKAMDNVITGASLYGRAKVIEQKAQQQRE